MPLDRGGGAIGEHILLQLMVSVCASPVGLAFEVRQRARTKKSELRMHLWCGSRDDLWVHVRTLDAVSRAAVIMVVSRRLSFSEYEPLPGGGGHLARGYFADDTDVRPVMDTCALLREIVGWVLLGAADRAAVGVSAPTGVGMYSPSAASLFGDTMEMCGRALFAFARMLAPASELAGEARRLAGAIAGPVVPSAPRHARAFGHMRTLSAFGVGVRSSQTGALATSFAHGDNEPDFVATATHALWCSHCAPTLAVAPAMSMGNDALSEAVALAVEANSFAEIMAGMHALTR